jgi:UDPglucose 6-dehydrogenase
MIGTGYVGLVTGTCFSEIGHNVICVDKDKSKIDTLNAGRIPIYEPGLDALVAKNRRNKRLRFTTNMKEGVESSDLIFVAVNTPPLLNGGADLSFVEACTREVALHAHKPKLLIEKSTVPVQTGQKIQQTLAAMGKAASFVEVASNPEFLREGSAIKDFLKPDRIVIGVGSARAEKQMRELYAKIKVPIVVTDINSAELIKHASNSFLALKISYINAIAQLCEKVGADVEQVALGMGLDARIGKSFLNAGIGYGGSCFPKDVSAFIKIAESNGLHFGLLKETEAINNAQRAMIVSKLEHALWTLKGKKIAILGLAFKPNTDDLRNAPAIDIINGLLEHGASVKAYDPVAQERMKTLIPNIDYAKSAMDALAGADAAVLVTEWDEFKKLSPKRMKSVMAAPILVDGRNLFDPARMKSEGFLYHSIGRKPVA